MSCDHWAKAKEPKTIWVILWWSWKRVGFHYLMKNFGHWNSGTISMKSLIKHIFTPQLNVKRWSLVQHRKGFLFRNTNLNTVFEILENSFFFWLATRHWKTFCLMGLLKVKPLTTCMGGDASSISLGMCEAVKSIIIERNNYREDKSNISLPGNHNSKSIKRY